jgi:hypothetical protein
MVGRSQVIHWLKWQGHQWLAVLFLSFLEATAAASPIGLSSQQSVDSSLVEVAGEPTDLTTDLHPLAVTWPASWADLTHIPPRPDPQEDALIFGPFPGGLAAVSLTSPGSSQSLSFSLRPFADPHLSTTISADGRLSIGAAGDDLLLKDTARFWTGEARRLAAPPVYGSFMVLLQFEQTGGFLSGPFRRDATFSEVYSTLEEYDRLHGDTSMIITRHATFP